MDSLKPPYPSNEIGKKTVVYGGRSFGFYGKLTNGKEASKMLKI
jgi:hypothetical protein